ncbi:MAG: glycosyl hydrolase family 28-related protein, partial [Phycisphaerae bacterium]
MARSGAVSLLCASVAVVSAGWPGLCRAGGFVPPPGDGLVNVRTDCGAKGDGVTDDTAALKSVFEAGKTNRHPKFDSGRHIYLPAGIYLVSEPIRIGDKKKFIIGQDRARTVIRLKDNAAAFQDRGRPTPILNFGKGSRRDWHFAQNFGQRMVNLTIDAGRGNPGAVGVHYHTNNYGAIYHITIRSSDPQKRGAYGLHLSSGPGPGLAWDVLVDGFDVGCRIDGGLHSMTAGRLTVRNQRTCGYEAAGNFSSIWKLTSENRVPALIVRAGHVVLLDGDCRGGAGDQAAIRIDGGVAFCRNVRTSGYGKALSAKAGKKAPAAEIAGPNIDEFVRPKAYSLFGNEPVSLNLPVPEPPVAADWGDPRTWTAIECGKDSGRRIQKAIDDGAEQVYLLCGGTHGIQETIHVRGKVKRIFGAGAWYQSQGPAFGQDKLDPGPVPGCKVVPGVRKPVFRIEDGEPDTVYFEFINDVYGSAGWHFEHASKRTLVCRSASGTYRNTATGGKAFFLDAGPGSGCVIKGPQRVWAWQVNTESYTHNPHILNDAGTLFICGYKIEKDRTNVGTINGGWTEVLG